MAIVKSTSKVGDEEVDIYIEVDRVPEVQDLENPYQDVRESLAKKAATAVGDLFGEGLALSRKCAAKVIDSVQQMGNDIKPHEFEVQLTIKLDSEMGAVIAKASTGGQMQVTMKWTLKETPKQLY